MACEDLFMAGAGRPQAAQAGGQARVQRAQAALPCAREAGQLCRAAPACSGAGLCDAALCQPVWSAGGVMGRCVCLLGQVKNQRRFIVDSR